MQQQQQKPSLQKRPSTSDPIHDSNLMKFINDQNTKKKPQGKRCHPKQLFGVSHEAPKQFKGKNTLTADYGYQYTLDQGSNKDNFQYYSQQHFITLGTPAPGKLNSQKNFSAHYQKSKSTNNLAFHRRKGKMTQFLDKNAWMGNNYKIIGMERSQSARQFTNSQHKVRITKKKQKLEQRKNMIAKVQEPTKKTSHQELMKTLLAQKLKVMRGQKKDAFQLEVQSKINKQTQFQRNQLKKGPKIFGRKRQFQVNLPEWQKKQFQIQFLDWDCKQKDGTQEWQRGTFTSKNSIPSTQGTLRSQSRYTVRF